MVSQMDNKLIIVRLENEREREIARERKSERGRGRERQSKRKAQSSWRQIKIPFRADPKSDEAVSGPVPQGDS